ARRRRGFRGTPERADGEGPRPQLTRGGPGPRVPAERDILLAGGRLPDRRRRGHVRAGAGAHRPLDGRPARHRGARPALRPAVTALLSMWVGSAAAAALMLPIALGLVRALKAARSTESPRALLLAVAISASLGGVATPVGAPPNLIALGLLRQAGGELSFLSF